MFEVPDIFGGRRVDAGSGTTYEEKMRVPPPPPTHTHTHTLGRGSILHTIVVGFCALADAPNLKRDVEMFAHMRRNS